MDGWYVEGADEMAAVKDLDTMSDRAAAIVVATLVEIRLSSAIKSWLRYDEKLFERMFRTSGPLGSFSSKIDLAFLIGLFTEEAHRDLIIFKDIRNDFAHQLKALDFSSDRMKSLCAQFRLIELQVADIDDKTVRLGVPPYFRFFLHVSNYAELIHTPRGRFILTGRLFVAALNPNVLPTQTTADPWM